MFIIEYNLHFREVKLHTKCQNIFAPAYFSVDNKNYTN